MGHMKRGPFIPDRFDRAVIARGWGVLACIAMRLTAMLACLDGKRQVNAAHRLCRVGEAMARRLLVAQALLNPLPRLRPLTHQARRAFAEAARRRRFSPDDVRYKPPVLRKMRFRLSEPLAHYGGLDDARKGRARALAPAVRVEQYGILTVITHSTHGDRFKPPLSVARAPIPADLMPDAPGDAAPGRLTRRTEALADVIARPGAHARRMARWMVRARLKRYGRRQPLRLGRAPGQIWRFSDRDRDQFMLKEAQTLARRALAAWPRPPRSDTLAKATGPPP